MTVQRPELLALAPLAAILFALAIGAHWRRLRRLGQAYESTAVGRLLPASLGRFPTARFLYLVGAGVLVGLAAAGPVWFDPEPPEAPPPLDVAIVVDLSLSMTAEDAAPSRIERAREVVDLLTEELPSVRFSLVVYSGWPYMLVPPTDDPTVIRYFAESLQPDVVQDVDRGNALAETLALAGETLESRVRPEARRAILVLSDGDVYEDEEILVRAASDAAAGGHEVWVAGVGTEAGAPVTLSGEPFLDVGGRPVLVRQDRDLLRAVADAGGGRYEDVNHAAGAQSLLERLRVLSGDTEADPAEPFDTTALLALLAVPLLLWEGAVDAGRGRRRDT